LSGVAVWDTLKVEIQRILDGIPGALLGYPDPRSDRGREPPLGIQLAPWAVEVAQDLHDRFGEEVALQVGALTYPGRAPVLARLPDLGPVLDPNELAVELPSPLEVRSGYDLRSALRVRSRADGDLDIRTNGGVTGYIVDLGGGAPLGGYAGGQRLPMVTFRVEPSGSTEIPLLVGTASFVPDLGYAIPAGSWGLRVPLVLGDGRRLSTPTLPITVTA
jgi:hypothetical protein